MDAKTVAPAVTRRSKSRRSKGESRAEDVFAKILTIQRAIQSGMQAMDGSVGMSGSQLSAMWHISAAPGLRVTALAAAMCVQHSTASNLLDKLEKRDLIRRERNSHDQRVVSVFLTDRGNEIVKRMPGPLHGKLRNALRDLPEGVLDSLGEGMAALLARLASTQKGGAGGKQRVGQRVGFGPER